ncbi:MAG: hypothetical protein M0Q90_06485, partial [Bacteroidales bacterium]|nr:hypothetical protein [Bacteroidales bacterium]
TGGLDAALWGNDIGEGMLWGATGGAIFTTFTSENFSNLTKGEGFYTNKNVFNSMMEKGMDKQAILDYFGFEGSYKPNKSAGAEYVEGKAYYGSTKPSDGQISYGDLAFSSYDNLRGTYQKELYTSLKVRNGLGVDTFTLDGLEHMKYFPEEAKGFYNSFKNNGLYPNSTFNYLGQANAYWSQMYGVSIVERKWYHFIYKIPRRW